VRAVAYARVSSAAQRERETIASQLRVLPEFIERRGWELTKPITTYVDDGHTAKSGNLEARLGLTALLRDAALGVFDVVVVVDLDRLTRAEDLGERYAILGAFQRAHVQIATVNTGQVMDLSTSMGDLSSTLYAFFAAEENRKRRERTVQGKLTAIARGRKPSGPTPYGLDYDRATGAWIVHPEHGPIVVEIYERVAAGWTTRAIADDLNARGIPRPRRPWSRGSVHQLLKSRHPIGEWTVDKRRRMTIAVPAIITEAQWQRAHDHLMRHKRRGLRRTRHVYLLEGLAVCGACGGRIHIRSACGHPKNQPAYVCSRRKIAPDAGDRCSATILKVSDADARVWAVVTRTMKDPSTVAELERQARTRAGEVKDWQADAEGYRRHLKRLDRQVAALLVRYRRELITDDVLDTELLAVQRERTAVRAQLAAAERAVLANDAIALDAPSAWLEALNEIATNATPEEQRRVVVELVQRGGAVVVGQSIELTLTVEEGSRGEVGGDARVALAPDPCCSSAHETHVRIRVVA